MAVKSFSAGKYGNRPTVAKPEFSVDLEGTPGKYEVMAVIIISLIIFAAVVIRMPFHSGLVNGIYTLLALAGLLSYIRFRLQIRPPLLMIICPGAAVLLDIVGNHFGLFSVTFGILPYDVVAHFVGTGLSFAAVIWLLQAIIKRFNYRIPSGMVVFFAITTTFSLAAFYEIVELWDEQLFNDQRIWTPADTPHDLASDIAGAVAAALIYALIVKKPWRAISDPSQRQASGDDAHPEVVYPVLDGKRRAK